MLLQKPDVFRSIPIRNTENTERNSLQVQKKGTLELFIAKYNPKARSSTIGMVDYISKCYDCSHSFWVICWPLFNIFLLEPTIYVYLRDCNSYFYECSHFSIRVSLTSIQIFFITVIFLRGFGWSQSYFSQMQPKYFLV